MSKRTHIRPLELRQLLCEGRYVIIQTEGRGTRHLLTYSANENIFLVVIYDPKDRVIITVATTARSRPGALSTFKERNYAQKLALGEVEPSPENIIRSYYSTKEYKIWIKIISVRDTLHHFPICFNVNRIIAFDPGNIIEKKFVLFLKKQINSVLDRGDLVTSVEIHTNGLAPILFPLHHLKPLLKDDVMVAE